MSWVDVRRWCRVQSYFHHCPAPREDLTPVSVYRATHRHRSRGLFFLKSPRRTEPLSTTKPEHSMKLGPTYPECISRGTLGHDLPQPLSSVKTNNANKNFLVVPWGANSSPNGPSAVHFQFIASIRFPKISLGCFGPLLRYYLINKPTSGIHRREISAEHQTLQANLLPGFSFHR